MVNDVLFSVIVPIYNIDETTLRKCIESLMKQSVEEAEFILVNDGSVNGCNLIMDEYAQKDSRIICIHQKNQGVSGARNNGLKHSKGDYILFVDGDDWIRDGLLSFLKQLLMKNDRSEDVIFFKYCSASSEANIEEKKSSAVCHQVPYNEIKKWLLYDIRQINPGDIEIGSPWGKVFSRSFLKKNSISYPVNVPRAQDRVFMAWCLDKAKSISYLDYFGYVYNDLNNTSATRKYYPNIIPTLEIAGKHLESVVINNSKLTESEKKAALIEQKYRFMTEWMILFFLHKQMRLDKKEQKNAMNAVYQSHTFQFLIKQNALNRRTLRRFHFGAKFETIIMLLANRRFELLYCFGKICRLIK